eukprot:jgi/Psemu1/257265/estExt_Genewise1Plus.C_2150017
MKPRRASVTEQIGGNIVSRSKGFKKLVDKIFAACDTSKSGEISKSELYVGMLSVHITLARYAGPAACFPPTREVSDQLFEAADADNSGSIDKIEFENILMILGAQIVSRMFTYYAILILFVPWFATIVIDSTDCIPKGGFLEGVANQVISASIFMLAVPLVWNAIDSKTETTIDRMNSTTSSSNSEPESEVGKKDD